MVNVKHSDKEVLASQLRGSFLLFCKMFFPIVTGRDFIVSSPIGRESHHIVIARALTNVFRENTKYSRLGICVPPRCSKSVLVSLWAAWSYAHYPDCNFIYISYGSDLASKHTAFIKTIMTCKHYQYLFDLDLRKDSRARDHFETTSGGSTTAFGSTGAIVGQDAGLPGLNRFSGAVIIDDPHKLDEVHSDKIRKSVIDNYETTIRQRAPIGTPIIFIGQRGHEDDLAAFLQSGKDTLPWRWINLKGLDDAGNALYPEVHPKELLLSLQDKSPYVFASQFQQDPLPAGGGLFKPEWFVELDDEPAITATFITADTAETEKAWNDATVFSFFGIYEIETYGKKTGILGLHWLDCMEIRVEPKDLEANFLDFFANCSHYSIPPHVAAIEKKSTGVTLLSTLENLRGIAIRKIDRNANSGSKAQRFIDIQSIVSARRISFPKHGKHNQLCINHMSKITANDSHRHDDIADTLSDAIRLAFIDKTIYINAQSVDKNTHKLDELNKSFLSKHKLGAFRDGTGSKRI